MADTILKPGSNNTDEEEVSIPGQDAGDMGQHVAQGDANTKAKADAPFTEATFNEMFGAKVRMIISKYLPSL
jgi:hypothetical protein